MSREDHEDSDDRDRGEADGENSFSAWPHHQRAGHRQQRDANADTGSTDQPAEAHRISDAGAIVARDEVHIPPQRDADAEEDEDQGDEGSEDRRQHDMIMHAYLPEQEDCAHSPQPG